MNDKQVARTNPYVGPRAFKTGETLYGRGRETLDLLDLLIAERIVLLYSPSGAGKTSLLHAALIPELKKRFCILGPMRVSLKPPSDSDPPDGTNRYVLSLLLSLEKPLPPEQQTPVAELATRTLEQYLAQSHRELAALEDESNPDGQQFEDHHTPYSVLVFDQFEEILTVDPTDRAAKAEFFAQVGAVLRDRQRWALFAMREEFLAGLDPYLYDIPTRLDTTYRLELLGSEAAKEAMQEPARAKGVEFTPAAADKLARDLAQVYRHDGTTTAVTGHHVEPVQLQVVCHRLWERLSAGDDEIGVDDVEGVGDVDTALREYYAKQVAGIAASPQVAGIAASTGARERVIRDWVEGQLITEQGIRGQVLKGSKRSEGLDNAAIDPLVDAHLVRAEERRGQFWLELAHDRLVKPVRLDNKRWRDEKLDDFQRQAALWDKAKRPDGFLLEAEKLAKAEKWVHEQGQELEEHEDLFLKKSRARRKVKRRQKVLTIGLVVMFFLTLAAAIFAGYQWNSNARQKATVVAALNEVATANSIVKVARETQQAAATDVNRAATEQAGAFQLRETALAAGTAADVEQLQTAVVQAAVAATAQEAARQLKGTAEAASTAVAAVEQTAVAQSESAVEAGTEAQATPTLSEPFDHVWASLENMQSTLGYPEGSPVSSWYAGQEFDHGFMYWRNNSGDVPDWIYAIRWGPDDDRAKGDVWHRFEDRWQESDDEISCPQAETPNGPRRGFGWVWCKRAEIERALGLPLEVEWGEEAGWQDFEHGVMLWDVWNNRVLVLFNDGSWQAFED